MPNVAMWGKALTVMPRITKQDWDGLDIVSRWLIASRAAVIIMTFTSAAFAGLLAVKAGNFDGVLFALVTLGLCLAHATNNLVNDLTDYWKGVDEGVDAFAHGEAPALVLARYRLVAALLPGEGAAPLDLVDLLLPAHGAR